MTKPHTQNEERYEDKPQGWFFPQPLVNLYEDGTLNGEEVMLLGKIVALRDPEKGGCWASNDYLANWWGKTSSWISITISKFQKLGLVDCNYFKKGKKTRRIIRISWIDLAIRKVTGCDKSHIPPTRKVTATNNTSYYTSKRNEAHASSSSFGLLESNSDTSIAAKLARRFLRFLVRENLHLERADLPGGNSAQSINKRNITLYKWKRAFTSLLSQLEGNKEKVRQVMDWYFEHYRDPFVGTYRAATTFCENFLKVEKAMYRDTGEEPEEKRKMIYRPVQLASGKTVMVSEYVD